MANFRQKLHKIIDTVFLKRTYSTIALFALMGAILFIGKAAIEILLCLLALGLILEWVPMCKLHPKFVPVFMILVIYSAFLSEYLQRDKLAFGILFIGASFCVLMSWFAWQRRLLWIAAGLIYIGIPILSMFWICENVHNHIGLFWWIIAIVAGNDILAYLTGITIGGPKLIPEISPKKTWSGFVGGIVASLCLGYLTAPAELPKYQAILASLIIAILATLGDFFESFIKRANGVKDSGTIIPGHGGLFDRVDGFLLVFPFVAWICLQSSALLATSIESPETTQLKKELNHA